MGCGRFRRGGGGSQVPCEKLDPRQEGGCSPSGSLQAEVWVPGLLTRMEGGLGSMHVSRERGGSFMKLYLEGKVLAVAEGPGVTLPSFLNLHCPRQPGHPVPCPSPS